MRNLKSGFKKHSAILCMLGLSLALDSCGKNAFNVSSVTENIAGPGTYNNAPKVDILLAESDSGAISMIYNTVSQQVSYFLSTLINESWNYHFATVPLIQQRSVQQVVGSIYDSNWGSSWVPAFPGQSSNAPGMIASSVFRSISNYTDFISTSDISSANEGMEPGLKNIQWSLQSGLGNSNFLRSDALLVIIVMSNQNDTSYINYCTGPDNNVVPCEQVPGTPTCTPSGNDPTGGSSTCGSQATSMNYFKSWFSSFKSNSRFYSVVAANNSSNCLGRSSFAGTRYETLATQSYDICSNSVNSVLNDLSGVLINTVSTYKKHYLMISQAPNTSDSITVVRNPGGNTANAQTIPQSTSNGWSYAGYVNNVYSINYPVNMNQVSGYAIQLNGSAELQGNDTSSVTYTPAGESNSVSQ